MSCDVSCDHGHMSLYCPKRKRKSKKIKRKIKLRKINKKKRKLK